MISLRISEEISFSVWGQTLAARYWPGEGMPILALHGWLDNANSFVPLAQHLPNPIVALDACGHGLSDHRPGQAPAHFIDYVRDVEVVARELGWGQFILLGHSMGAGVSCLFAATLPERIEKLVLIEGLGPLSSPAEKMAELLRKAIDGSCALAEKRKPVYAAQELAVKARMGGFGGLDEESSALLCQRGLMEVEGGWTWRADSRLRVASFMRMTEEQIEGFLRAIRVPTLLIIGEQSLASTTMFDHRIEWLSSLTIDRLDGRHHLHMENAQAVTAAIARFLSKPSVGNNDNTQPEGGTS